MMVARNWFLLAGAFFLLGALFLGFNIGGRAFSSPTEARYVQIPMGMLASGDLILPRLNGVIYFEKPPLFYWLQAASIGAFGLTEWSARLVTAVFTFYSCLLTGFVAWRIYGKATAIAAATILATTIYFYVNGRFIQIDMVVSAFIVTTMFLFIAGAVEPNRRRQIWLLRGAYLAAALAVMSKGLIGVVLPGMVVLVWIALTSQWRLIPKILIPSGLIVFLIVAVPWHVVAAIRNDDFLWFYFVHEHLIRYTTTEHGRTQPVWFFLPIVLFGFLPWTGDMIAGFANAVPRRVTALRSDPIVIFFVVWVVCIFSFYSVSGSKLIPYILPIFPPLAILAGRIVGPGFVNGRGGSGLGRWTFVALLGTAGATLPILPHIPAIQRIPDFQATYGVLVPYSNTLALILLLSAVLVIILTRLGRLSATVPIMLLSAVMGWTVLSLGGSAISPNTIKPLAHVIKENLEPGDIVASFGTFYYDLPVYVGRNVVIVGNVAEFQFGATQEDISDIVVSTDEIWRRWIGPEQIYMLVRSSTYDSWPESRRRQVYLIDRTTRAVALTNRALSVQR